MAVLNSGIATPRARRLMVAGFARIAIQNQERILQGAPPSELAELVSRPVSQLASYKTGKQADKHTSAGQRIMGEPSRQGIWQNLNT